MSKPPIEPSLKDRTETGATEHVSSWRAGSGAIDGSDQSASVFESNLPLRNHLRTGAAFALPEIAKDKSTKQRFGLPAGFVSRLSRYGRTVLFEDNVYRLPSGVEYIPQPPVGTLGSRNHLYALLTLAQYEARTRGSVYVRTDGRIFDYAFAHNDAERELFDTGLTIHDLERTGRYAPTLPPKPVNTKTPKAKRTNQRKSKARKRSSEFPD